MVRNAHDDDADDFMPDRRDAVDAGKCVPKKVLVTWRVFFIKRACHDIFQFFVDAGKFLLPNVSLFVSLLS